MHCHEPQNRIFAELEWGGGRGGFVGGRDGGFAPPPPPSPSYLIILQKPWPQGMHLPSRYRQKRRVRVIRQSRKDKEKRRNIDMDLEAQDSSSHDSEQELGHYCIRRARARVVQCSRKFRKCP